MTAMTLPASRPQSSANPKPPSGPLSQIEGGVPETWTPEPETSIPSASNPSTPRGRSWTGGRSVHVHLQPFLVDHALPEGDLGVDEAVELLGRAVGCEAGHGREALDGPGIGQPHLHLGVPG